MNWMLVQLLLFAIVVAKQIFAYSKLLITPLIVLVLSVRDVAEVLNSVAPTDTSSLGIKEILSQHGCCLTVKTQRCGPD